MKNERTCIACRKKTANTELLRISLNKEGNVNIDEGNKSAGRGAYLCKNKNCFEKAVKSKALNRTFKKQIDKSIYDKLQSRGEEFE